MRRFIILIAFLIPTGFARSQNNSEKLLLESKRKTPLFYVEIHDSRALVFTMGSYMDVAGSGYSLLGVDTLANQGNGIYEGATKKVAIKNGSYSLTTHNGKARQFSLKKPSDVEKINVNRNNAYYLDAFFALATRLNEEYKMSHYSFRGGFNSWQTLSNKNIDYAEFRKFTDNRLAEIEDSIRKAQAGHIFVTHKLIHEMPSIEYDSLKQNIFKLPTAWNSSSRYFGKALNELSKQRPELYFRMAEDFPEHRQLIFASVEDNKHVIETLKAVEGYSEVKKQFFKERRFNKSMPYKLVATTAVTIGLIVYLIAK